MLSESNEECHHHSQTKRSRQPINHSPLLYRELVGLKSTTKKITIVITSLIYPKTLPGRVSSLFESLLTVHPVNSQFFLKFHRVDVYNLIYPLKCAYARYNFMPCLHLFVVTRQIFLLSVLKLEAGYHFFHP